MNKFTKSILALGLALSIIVGVGGVSVFAAMKEDVKRGWINGYNASAVSTITETKASARTSYVGSGATTVYSQYTYVKLSTLENSKITRSYGNYGPSSVNFIAPKNCRSIAVVSSHEVHAGGSTWYANTKVHV